MVSSSAYLLFYRRRSDVPLGGPRFQDIISRFADPQEPSEDELAGSGEDQSLGGNFSRGSSGALTGVEATRRQAGHGLGRTIKPCNIEGLPAYQTHEENEDAAPLMYGDAQMNDGLMINNTDEGIDMDMNFGPRDLNFLPSRSPKNGNGWSFANLGNQKFKTGRGSEVDLANNSEDDFQSGDSNIVEHNSSASSSSIRNRLREFDDTPAEGNGEDGSFEDPSPVPDVYDSRVSTMQLHRDIQARLRKAFGPHEFRVSGEELEDMEDEPATEIHVDDSEILKMD